MESWAIMCCGCGRGLGTNPANEFKVVGENGFVNLDQVASFKTKAEADEAASRSGWQIADKLGANHRCPDCKTQKGSQRRGAYINLQEVA